MVVKCSLEHTSKPLETGTKTSVAPKVYDITRGVMLSAAGVPGDGRSCRSWGGAAKHLRETYTRRRSGFLFESFGCAKQKRAHHSAPLTALCRTRGDIAGARGGEGIQRQGEFAVRLGMACPGIAQFNRAGGAIDVQD
jgi:hypothetical protein